MTKPRRKHTPDKKFDFDELSEFPRIWMLLEDLRTYQKFDRLLAKDKTLGVQNDDEINLRKREIEIVTGSLDVHGFLLPADFPPTRLVMAQADYAPDYFSFGSHKFCSRRLREALAQPPEVLQFLPVDLVAGGDGVRAQDYKEMHVLAQQPVMDMHRSVYQTTEIVQHTTKQVLKRIRWIELFVLIDGLQPRSEIFRADETKSFTFVNDSLAARILHSGCSGMIFRDPVTPLAGMRIERYRTTTGIAERRVGFLD